MRRCRRSNAPEARPSRCPRRLPNSIARAMSTDSLGNLFGRLRDSVDDEEPVGPPELSPAPSSATPSSATPAADEPTVAAPGGSAASDGGSVVEYEALVVEVADEFAVEPAQPEPKWPMWGVAESLSLDDVGLRRRRDAAVETAMGVLLPGVKRRLQDEQNELLDSLRRQKSKIDVDRAMPSADEQLRAWAELLTPTLDDTYASGRTIGGGRTRPAP